MRLKVWVVFLWWSLFLCSCGTHTSSKETLPKVESPVAGKGTDLTQSTALVLLSIVHDGILQPCTGIVLENGQILTAGHCFLGVSPNDLATKVYLRWVDLDPQNFKLQARSEHVLVKSVLASPDLDLALVRVGPKEPIPSKRAVISNTKIDSNLRALVPGPSAFSVEATQVDFESSLGYFSGTETELRYDSEVKGGFSGAPVMAVAPELVSNPGEFFKPARLNVIGLHLGIKNGIGFGISGVKIMEFLIAFQALPFQLSSSFSNFKN